MNTRCSIALLESALADNLPADDEASLQKHLEECDECSATLERMAGGAAWCQEAASLLSGDDLDATVPSRDEWSPVDFTVEHLEPADEPNLLGRLGGYDVLEIIGYGGMGVVLKAFDRDLKRCVAIKVLAPHLAHSALAKKRFAREAQAAAAIVHPNVLAIHQVQPTGRLPFLVMPLVAGESLAQRLADQGRLELKETLRIGMQAAAGLAAAHEQGLVHRDVKPANILLEKGVERAVLTDFGLARAADDVALTRWGIIAGTPQYMSPEQARGEPLDGRSDLFSLGCVLYETATGVSPFRTESIMATMRRLVDDAPQAMASLNPELPGWFIGIVDRLLAKDPSRRFGSATEVSKLLEGCLAHLQQPTNVPLPAALPKPAAHRGRWSSLIGVRGVLVLLAALGGLAGMAFLATAPPDISGQWSSEEWGHVDLKKTGTAEYTGTYRDSTGKRSGTIQLKWLRIEQRFQGTWREDQNRSGVVSLHLIDNELRGAYTAKATSETNPATIQVADLTWSRVGPAPSPPVVEDAGPVSQSKIAKVEDGGTGHPDNAPAPAERKLQSAVRLDRARFEPGTRTKIEDRKIGGSRHWMVYVPTDYTPSRRWPIIYSYHGHGETPHVRPFRELTDGKGFIIVGMEYSEKNKASAAVDIQNFLRIHGELLKRLKIDEKLVFISGYKQGGGVASLLTEAIPNTWAGMILLSAGRQGGLVDVDGHVVPSNDKGMPIFVGAESKDPKFDAAEKTAEAYKEMGAVVTFETFANVGHVTDPKDPVLKRWLHEQGPVREARSALESASRAEKQGKLGEAFTLFDSLGKNADVEDCALAARSAAKKIGDRAEATLAEAERLITDKKYDQAEKEFGAMTATYAGSSFADRAKDRLTALANSSHTPHDLRPSPSRLPEESSAESKYNK